MIYKPRWNSATIPKSLRSICIIFLFVQLRTRDKQLQHKKTSNSNHSIEVSKPERQTNTNYHDQKTWIWRAMTGCI